MGEESPFEPPKKRTRLQGGLNKRAPYVLAACDHCHGRKLKCSGDRPCERCKKQGISCSYPVDYRPTVQREPNLSDELLANINTLQSQLSEVKAQLQSVNAKGSNVLAFASPTSSAVTSSSQHHLTDNEVDIYAGPTSSTYSIHTADSRLSSIQQPIEIQKDLDESLVPLAEESLTTDDRSTQAQYPSTSTGLLATSAETLDLAKVRNHLQTFQDVFGVLHPVPCLNDIETQSFQLLRAAKSSLDGTTSSCGDSGYLEMFKMIIAIAEVCNEGTATPLSRALYNSVEPMLGSAAFARTITQDFRILLFLVALYHFSCEDLALGTRAVMIGARTAVEEGLYRKETLAARYSSQSERDQVVNMLWSIFCLDMQFNYAAGLPNLLDPDDIDLPPPIDAPYVSAMLEYVRLGAHAWTTIVKRDILVSGRLPSKDKVEFFQYQLHRWQQQMHPDVRFDAQTIETDPSFFTINRQEDVTGVYLKSLCYLRSNQIQILVLRPVLMRPDRAKSSPDLANRVVSIAQRSIKVLNLLETVSNLYRKRQMIFNHFLGSALAVLFLAAALDAEQRLGSSYDPSTNSLLASTEELHTGLQLVDHMQSTSLRKCFERPRKLLSRLRVLKAYQNKQTSTSNEEINKTAEGLPDFLFDFDAALDGDDSALDIDGSLLNLDWFDGNWTDPTEPFGVLSWI